eukprot:gene16998-biopygen8294
MPPMCFTQFRRRPPLPLPSFLFILSRRVRHRPFHCPSITVGGGDGGDPPFLAGKKSSSEHGRQPPGRKNMVVSAAPCNCMCSCLAGTDQNASGRVKSDGHPPISAWTACHPPPPCSQWSRTLVNTAALVYSKNQGGTCTAVGKQTVGTKGTTEMRRLAAPQAPPEWKIKKNVKCSAAGAAGNKWDSLHKDCTT